MDSEGLIGDAVHEMNSERRSPVITATSSLPIPFGLKVRDLEEWVTQLPPDAVLAVQVGYNDRPGESNPHSITATWKENRSGR